MGVLVRVVQVLVRWLDGWSSVGGSETRDGCGLGLAGGVR